MGLDISVYTDATPLPEVPEGDDIYAEGTVHAFVYDGQERSLRGLDDGTWYQADYDHGFRAGSYSGYGRFRTDLCLAALGVKPEVIWKDPEAWTDRPFYELINFADNEGTIGPEAAADLYADFADGEEAVLAAFSGTDIDRDWFVECYANWKEAFRVASEGHGLVEFH